MKQKFGIIGKPLSHSLSPMLHSFWFDKYQINGNYSLMEIETREIEEVISKIKSGQLRGINVTVPYKQSVIPFLDTIVNEAKETQSVNTIMLNEDGKLEGNNTDVYGFEQSFINKLNTQNLKHNKVLVLGAGGVTPSIIYALKRKGFEKVFISNRSLKKAEDIKNRFPFIKIIEWEKIDIDAEDMDIIINATSLGLKNGDIFEQEFNNMKQNLIYYDVIYNPIETMMVKKFKKRNIQTFNGFEMFIYQGQKSFYLWNKVNPELDEDLRQTIMSKLK